MIRVFIVDDHELVRRGLTTAINAEPDMEACGSAEDSASALTLIMRLVPDLVIVDISLKSNSSIDLIRSIRSFDERIQIICLSMRDQPENASRVIAAGAREYMVKQGVVGRVTNAIRRVQHKRNPVAAGADRRRGFGTLAGAGASLSDLGLTDTECEIVELIGRGLPTQGIAAILHMSVEMVEIHRRNIMAALRIRDAAALVQFCVDSVRASSGSASRVLVKQQAAAVMGSR